MTPSVLGIEKLSLDERDLIVLGVSMADLMMVAVSG